MEFIEKYIDNIDWDALSSNKFLYSKNVYIKSINVDIKKNKNIVYNELNNKINKDINNLICKFIYYN
jgi:hypothetical protein